MFERYKRVSCFFNRSVIGVAFSDFLCFFSPVVPFGLFAEVSCFCLFDWFLLRFYLPWFLRRGFFKLTINVF